MKLFALLATLLLAASCTNAGAVADASPDFRIVVNTGGYASADEPAAIVATDEQTYRNTWNAMIRSTDAPAIDFATETAVFLFAGERPTGGYSIEVRGVSLDGDTLVIDGNVKTPGRSVATTQAITSPYVVLAVKSRSFDDVRWNP